MSGCELCVFMFGFCLSGSSLRRSHVVDARQGGSQDEGNHLQGAPMGGHA